MTDPRSAALAYARVWTDGGGDPTFDELDGFLEAHFGARAVYVSEFERLQRIEAAARALDKATGLDTHVAFIALRAALATDGGET